LFGCPLAPPGPRHCSEQRAHGTAARDGPRMAKFPGTMEREDDPQNWALASISEMDGWMAGRMGREKLQPVRVARLLLRLLRGRRAATEPCRFGLGRLGRDPRKGKQAIADGRWQTRCKQDGGGMPAHPPRLFDEPTWARLRWTSLLRAIKRNLGTSVIA